MTDNNQLESALLNFVVNARDAMPDGGEITIELRACAEEDRAALSVDPDKFVRLVVSDTGEGMDEETARQAIEPFFTTKGIGKGTGLGLSMVQGLIVQSGGAMRIESEKGVGTSVKLWLPIATADAIAGPSSASAEPIEQTEGEAADDPRRRRRSAGADEHRRLAGGSRP